jgi:hypothetical protein
MHKLLSIGAAATVALGLSLVAVAPSQAFPHHNAVGVGIAAGLFGLAAGAALANASDHAWYHGDDWDQHVQDCEDAYDNYDWHTDTYPVHVHHHWVNVRCDID